jgi:hypothetical protein
MIESAGRDPVALNILAESLLVGSGMFNYPSDPRRQAWVIQEIADHAQDRVRAVRRTLDRGGGAASDAT